MSSEDRLRQELHRASGTLPSVGIDFEATLSRGRTARFRSRLVTVAAAAVVVAVGVGATAVVIRSADPGSGPVRVLDRPAGSPSPQQQPTPSPSTSPVPSPNTSPGQRTSFDQVEPVLRAWLEAVQESDEERAWELMTAEARTAVGRDRFDRMMASALPEGLGAFADATTFHYVVVSDDREARVVAVVSGEVTREGTSEFAAAAIPMRVSDDKTLVDDPIIDRDRYYDRVAVFASVSAGPLSFRAGDELTVEFASPEGATAVRIALDDDRQPLPTEFDPETGRATATLDRDLEAGRHIATVIVIHESGRLYPEAIVFEAAAP